MILEIGNESGAEGISETIRTRGNLSMNTGNCHCYGWGDKRLLIITCNAESVTFHRSTSQATATTQR